MHRGACESPDVNPLNTRPLQHARAFGQGGACGEHVVKHGDMPRDFALEMRSEGTTHIAAASECGELGLCVGGARATQYIPQQRNV